MINGSILNGAAIPGAVQIGIKLTSTDYSVIYGNFLQNPTNIQENSCTGNNVSNNVFG